MEPVSLILLGGAALLLSRKASSPGVGGGGSALQKAPPPPAPAPLPPSSVPQLGGPIGAVLSAGTAAYAAGVNFDQSLNPNTNKTSQVTAGVAAGVIGGASAAIIIAIAIGGVAILLTPIGWVAGILIAVAALTYAVVVVVQDLERLAYGQAGARKDFLTQKDDITAQCQDQIAIAQPKATQAQLDRQLIPFIEGWMSRMNWSAYQTWMIRKNLVVAGDPQTVTAQSAGFPNIPDPSSKGALFPGTSSPVTPDLLWHANFAIDRGYFVGTAAQMRSVPSVPGWNAAEGGGFLSQKQDWVLAHCPSAELAWTPLPFTNVSTPFKTPDGKTIWVVDQYGAPASSADIQAALGSLGGAFVDGATYQVGYPL